jgi:hypothetical protein
VEAGVVKKKVKGREFSCKPQRQQRQQRQRHAEQLSLPSEELMNDDHEIHDINDHHEVARILE